MSQAESSKNRPVTMKILADHLGVSITTVARGLSGSSKTSKAMIERVNEAADKLGYVRNMDGVKLRTGKSYVIAALLPVTLEEEVGDSVSLGLLNGIYNRCAGTPYSIRAVPCDSDEQSLDELKKLIIGRNADGFILNNTDPQDVRVKYLLEQDFPFVTYGRTELFSPHPYFDIDNEDSAAHTTKAMIDEGCRSIALVDGPAHYMYSRQRLRGYRGALQAAGIPFREELVRNIDLKADIARAAAAEILASQPVDAFICVNEVVMLGCRAALRLQEQSDNVRFAMRVGTNIAEYLAGDMVTSHYSRIKAGYELADLLLRRLDGEPIEDLQVLRNCELRLGSILEI